MDAPIIIGGTGGSGTRVVYQALHTLGVFLGTKVNDAGDALHWHDFLTNTGIEALTHRRRLDYAFTQLPPRLQQRKPERIKELLPAYLTDCPPGSQWGIKHPRSIYCLPILHHVWPQMTFIHVIRDGRDMALSTNQNQLYRFYEPVFGRKLPADLTSASISLWQKINIEAAAFAKRSLTHYLPLRFEDICDNPAQAFAPLYERFGANAAQKEAIAHAITPPASLGRHHSLPIEAQEEMAKKAVHGLAAFGYVRPAQYGKQ